GRLLDLGRGHDATKAARLHHHLLGARQQYLQMRRHVVSVTCIRGERRLGRIPPPADTEEIIKKGTRWTDSKARRRWWSAPDRSGPAGATARQPRSSLRARAHRSFASTVMRPP